MVFKKRRNIRGNRSKIYLCAALLDHDSPIPIILNPTLRHGSTQQNRIRLYRRPPTFIPEQIIPIAALYKRPRQDRMDLARHERCKVMIPHCKKHVAIHDARAHRCALWWIGIDLDLD